jgi:branched-subunit amino acid aminotransferase/4-amino-4-deoxychorismate lyase
LGDLEAVVRLRFAPGSTRPGTTLIEARPAVGDLPSRRHAGGAVRVVGPEHVRRTHPGHKTLLLQPGHHSRSLARELGVEELIVVDDSGRVREGASSNVFCVRGGTLLTPPLRDGILPGITREVVLRLAREARIPVTTESVPESALRAADEIFLTSAIRTVMPVVAVDDRTLGPAGPITRRLAAATDRAIENREPSRPRNADATRT